MHSSASPAVLLGGGGVVEPARAVEATCRRTQEYTDLSWCLWK